MVYPISLFMCSLAALAGCAASRRLDMPGSLQPRQSTDTAFELYAYGADVPGHRVYYENGRVHEK